MRKRDWSWYILFAAAAVAAVAASVWTYVDMVGLCINIGSVVVMLAIIIWSLGCLNRRKGVGLIPLTDAAEDLRKASQLITKLADETGANVDEELCSREHEEPLLSHPMLHQAYSAHRRELDRLYRDGSSFRFSDVAEYVNQELLDHIGNMSFCDIVGGSMTGLGILGTFLGLMIGLQDFDPTSADTMLQTIPTLIDGIKIAFLTSIFGVVYSLLFNMYCRGIQEDASDALDGFLSAYYKHVVPQPGNDGFTQLIRYQQSQSDSMAQFAEDISLTMANSLKMNVVPTFQRIEESIAVLADKLAKSQSETMDEVASRFIDSMDKTMAGQLNHLGENIRRICQWQDETIAKMDLTVRAFSTAGDRVGAIMEKMDTSFTQLEEYVRFVGDIQSQINEGFSAVLMGIDEVAEKLETSNQHALDATEAQKNMIHDLNMHAAAALGRLEEHQNTLLAAQKELVSYTAAVQENVKNSTNAAVAAMQMSFGELSSTAGQVRNEIAAAGAAVQAQMSAAANAGAIAMQENMKAAAVSAAASAEEALEQIHVTAEQICSRMEAAAASVQTGLGASARTAMEAMDAAIQAQLRQMQNDLGSIAATQRAFIEGMNRSSGQLNDSAERMTAASQDLTNNLDKAMDRTYQAIDSQMAQIVRHLSGTIADIRDVTEQMPRVLAAASAQTQKTTEQYLAAVSDSQKQLAEEIRRHNRAISDRGEN